MKNIIDELYDLHLSSKNEVENEDIEYQSTLDKLIKLEAELLRTYPDCKELLEDFQTAGAVISTALLIVLSSAKVLG